MIVTVHWDVEGVDIKNNMDTMPDSVVEVPDHIAHEDVADWLTDKFHFFVFTWKEVRY